MTCFELRPFVEERMIPAMDNRGHHIIERQIRGIDRYRRLTLGGGDAGLNTAQPLKFSEDLPQRRLDDFGRQLAIV